MSDPRPETPFRPAELLSAGSFSEGRNYTNWRPRGTSVPLLLYTVAGSGRVASGNTVRHTSAGDVLLYDARVPQDYRTAGTFWQLLWSHFEPRPHWRPWLQWPEMSPGFRFIHLPEGDLRRSFEKAMETMVLEERRDFPGAVEFAANALERALLYAHAARAPSRWTRLDSRVRKAAERLTARLDDPPPVAEIASACGLSLSRMAHLFREETGYSPRQYLEKQRLREACRLLRSTGLPIAEVARSIGYENPFYFSNRFRKAFGCAPTAFRKRGDGTAGRSLRDHGTPPPGDRDQLP